MKFLINLKFIMSLTKKIEFTLNPIVGHFTFYGKDAKNFKD